MKVQVDFKEYIFGDLHKLQRTENDEINEGAEHGDRNSFLGEENLVFVREGNGDVLSCR